jgi:tetratricopeptide (TPR) repeat protein
MAEAPETPCPLCGEPVPAGATQCTNCGALLPARKAVARAEAAQGRALQECPECGEKLPAGEAECPACGYRFAPRAAPAKTGASAEEEHLLEELEWAIAGESVTPPPPLTPEVPAAVLEAKKALLEFVAKLPGVRRTTAETVAEFFLNVEHVGMTDGWELRALPGVTLDEAHRILEAAHRQLAAQGAAPAALPAASAPPSKPTAPVEPARTAVRPPPRLAPPPILASVRELAATATTVALPVAAAAATAGVAGHTWGTLFLCGVLFGTAAVLTFPGLRAARDLRSLLPFLVGAAALATAPAAAYLGAPSLPAVAVGLAGAFLVGFAAWRLRRGVGVFLAWTAGLLLLTVLAVAPLAFVSAGPAAPALWAIGGGLAFPASLFVTLRQVLRHGAETRLVRADEAHGKRDFAKAVEAYDAALALSRWSGRETSAAWAGKGATLVAAGRFAEAVEALDRALAAAPENEVAWINKGTAFSHLGRMNEALRCYNAAIKANAAYEVAWNNKGNALARLGKHDLALQCYERALEIDPAFRTAWVNKGFVLAKLGRFREAAECANAAIRLTTGVAGGA